MAAHRATDTPPGTDVPAPTTATRTCRVCKEQFRSDADGPRACKYHPGHYSGRLNRIGTAYLEEEHEQQVRGGPR
eukprot:CAMPEP_0172194434 /NCGR_PEP_ID=MMETSP1050-20130122/25578_1 /TAXON_ID=233186 /ORGANISM="Cryptomonas curvata, Strain CCAP979/52" /LENGTH=74 /DNA_ID=CAMNT_0012870241 /DNA_START=90 /DNA_END=311 /DNA_ORIENTATION=-